MIIEKSIRKYARWVYKNLDNITDKTKIGKHWTIKFGDFEVVGINTKLNHKNKEKIDSLRLRIAGTNNLNGLYNGLVDMYQNNNMCKVKRRGQTVQLNCYGHRRNKVVFKKSIAFEAHIDDIYITTHRQPSLALEEVITLANGLLLETAPFNKTPNYK